MIRIGFSTALLAIACHAASAGAQQTSWRFIDTRGQEAFPGRFPRVSNSGFQNGVVQVCGSKTCGYIDRTGRVIWPWD